MDLAAEAGAELYVTGDVKYHDARKAEELGMALLDVGHFAAERYGFHRFGEVLEKDLVSQGWGIRVLYAKESDPLGPVPS